MSNPSAFSNDDKLAIKVNNSYKDNIELDDVFIYPYLKSIIIDKEKDNTLIEQNSNFLTDITNLRKKIIYGAETSGKSSLLRTLQKYYYKEEYISIIIDGMYLDQSSYKENNFKSIILKAFKKQYEIGIKTISKFEQFDKNKIVLFIDGLEKSKLNSEYRANLINNIENLGYENILISAHESMIFEATMSCCLFLISKSFILSIFASFIFLGISGKSLNKVTSSHSKPLEV